MEELCHQKSEDLYGAPESIIITMRLFDRFSKTKPTEATVQHEMHNELLKYIQQRKFDLVLKFLLADQDYGRDAIRSFAMSETGNFLHLLMRYQPPQELVALVIHLMVTKCNSEDLVPEETRNARGETPLHVAVQHNCDASIVELLVKGTAGTLPVVTKDELLRYPLHWACVYCTTGGANARQTSKHSHATTAHSDAANMLQVITILSKVEPMTVSVKDVNGHSPLDLAVANQADEKVVQVLERAASRAARNEGLDSHYDDTQHVVYGYPSTIQCSECQDDVSSVSWQELAKNDENAIFEWERTFKRDCGIDDDNLDGQSAEGDSYSIHSGCAVHLEQV